MNLFGNLDPNEVANTLHGLFGRYTHHCGIIHYVQRKLDNLIPRMKYIRRYFLSTALAIVVIASLVTLLKIE